MQARMARLVFLAAAGVLLSGGLHAQGDASPPRIGVMHIQGTAGIVKSVSATQIEFSVPEHVTFTARLTPSTQITQDRMPVNLDQVQVGSAVFVHGTFDIQGRTVQASVIALMPARAVPLLERSIANYGTTWTAGMITAVQPGTISLQQMDGTLETVRTGANTSYALRRQPLTRDALHEGEVVRVELDRGDAGLADKVTIQGMAPNYRLLPW